MKITVRTPSEEKSEEIDYRHFLQIDVDGEEKVNFFDGEPEDANLSRDFNDAYKITDLMEMAFNAGKNGEDFTIEDVIIEKGENW